MLVACPALLSVGLHDAAKVRRLVGHVLQVRLKELRQHRDGALCRELLQRVQRPVVQVRVLQFACGGRRKQSKRLFIQSIHVVHTYKTYGNWKLSEKPISITRSF